MNVEMRIQPGQSVSSSSSIRPIESVRAVGGATQPSKAQAADASLSFEAVYQSQLPRVPMTDAHRKLDRIRSQLVAAKTDVPIHFNDAPARSAATNPYASYGYPRLIADPGQINANLTAATGECDG